MRAFVGRLAANSAAALTLGGTVLAIAIGLGAVGLSEVTAPHSPWDNALVKAGSTIAGAALMWIVAVFLVGMRATSKSEHFLEQLGKAIAEGKALRYVPARESEVADWAARCRGLLKAGLGEGEGRAFAVNYDEEKDESNAWHLAPAALDRLISILDRPYLRVTFEFDHKRDWMGHAIKTTASPPP